MIERIFVEDIPLNGRSFQTLIMLTQGAVKFLAGCEADSIELENCPAYIRERIERVKGRTKRRRTR